MNKYSALNRSSRRIRVPCIAILQSGFGMKKEVYISSESEEYFYGESDEGIPTGFLKRVSYREEDTTGWTVGWAGWEFTEYVVV